MLKRFHHVKKYITYCNAAILALASCFAVNIWLYMHPQPMQEAIDDWANLSRYSVANAELPPRVSGRVVFMGDSITDWCDFAQYYPGKPYVNRGIAGQFTAQMLARFTQDVIDLHPDVVVILGGINDLFNSTEHPAVPVPIIEENLIAMADLARGNKITVVLASILPVCGFTALVRSPHSVSEINRFVQSYCETNGIIYLDYYSALVGEDGLLRDELSIDCLHLNVEGYKIMAPLAEEAIKQAFGQRIKI